MAGLEPEPSKVALVVVAHPDDAEFIAAGAVASWVDDGWDVHKVWQDDMAYAEVFHRAENR